VADGLMTGDVDLTIAHWIIVVVQGAYKSGKPGNLREFCNSGKLRENSGNLKCTQAIFHN